MGLITISDLEKHLQQTIGAGLQDAAQESIDDGSGVVLTECERLEEPWTVETVPAAVATIVKRLAARLFANPQQRVSYTGPDGLNYSGGPVRLLTDDERAVLANFTPRKKKVGMIRMSPAPWSVPDTTTTP